MDSSEQLSVDVKTACKLNPDDFTIELDEVKYCWLSFGESLRFQEAWSALKSEMVKRGYRIDEWIDWSTNTHKARFRFLPT